MSHHQRAFTACKSTENNSLANGFHLLSFSPPHYKNVTITKNKAQITINVMKFLALHILISPFDLVSGSKIGAMLSVPSEATTKERDVFDNTQIATSLYIII